MEVQMLRWTRELTARERRLLCSRLPDERRIRLSENDPRETEVLLAYGLLGCMVKEFLGWDALPEITVGKRGKPRFSRETGICFSLSHTENAVLVGLAEREIGVDVEKIRPAPPHLSRCWGVQEDELFWEIWVRQEAAAKCSGEGLQRAQIERPQPFTDVRTLKENGYEIGVACPGEPWNLSVRERTIEELFSK